jgi:hypothetical protein
VSPVEKHVKKVAHFFQERMVNTAQSILSFPPEPDQAGFMKDFKLLRNSGLTDPETLFQLSDTKGFRRNQVQDFETRFLAERTKRPN